MLEGAYTAEARTQAMAGLHELGAEMIEEFFGSEGPVVHHVTDEDAAAGEAGMLALVEGAK